MCAEIALIPAVGENTPKGWNVRMLHFRDIFKLSNISFNLETIPAEIPERVWNILIFHDKRDKFYICNMHIVANIIYDNYKYKESFCEHNIETIRFRG